MRGAGHHKAAILSEPALADSRLEGTAVNIRNTVVIEQKRPPGLKKDTSGFLVRLDYDSDARANVKARTRAIMRTWLGLAAVHGAAITRLSMMRDLYKAAHRKALRDFLRTLADLPQTSGYSGFNAEKLNDLRSAMI
jgi:hypothetical protein